MGGPHNPSPGVQQVLQQVTQPPEDKLSPEAPKVSTKKENRSLEGTTETKQTATEDKDAVTDYFVTHDQPEEIPNGDEEILAVIDEAEVETIIK